MVTGLYAKEMKWHAAETIHMYTFDQSRVFNLKDHVEYLKIQWVENGKNKYMTIRRVTLDDFDARTVKQFRNLKPKYSAKANLKNKGNAFFIDDKGKIWQMDMIEDVISLLGDIDTPAEAQLVLWLHQNRNAKVYSKTSGGYKMLVEVYERGKCHLDEVLVHRNGKLTSRRSKQKCQKIAKKQKIKNRYIKYESFTDIVIDQQENIYLLGRATDTRSDNAGVVTLDKYNRNGKKIWQRIIRDGYTALAEKLALDSKYIYLIKDSDTDMILQYSKDGELISEKVYDGNNKKNFEAIVKHSNTNKLKKAPYYRNKNKNEIYFAKQVRSKNGNTYAVGAEIEFIPQDIQNIPVGECGDADELNGALIVKFDKRGDQVWSKVIDLKW